MIFPFLIPYLKGVMSFSKASITWSIVFLMVVVHITTSENVESVKRKMDEIVSNKQFLRIQGDLYSQFISRHEKHYARDFVQLNRKAREKGSSSKSYMASLAMHDGQFLNTALNSYSTYDRVEYNWWSENINEILVLRSELPRYMLGVQGRSSNLLTWISYQFVHDGWLHLISNMVFLIIFGAFLERAFGSMVLVTVFVASGFMGAGVYLLSSDMVAAPLLGASGSVTGVVAFLCVCMWRRPIRFIYMLMVPVSGYMGYVKLPAWVALFFWLLGDLTKFILQLNGESTGVANSAHLGGMFAGTVLALSYIFLKQASKKQKQQSKVASAA